MANLEYGVQLFTLRKYTQTPEGVKQTFKRLADMDVKTVQLSATCKMDAKSVDAIAKDNGIKIACTHSSFAEMKEDFKKLCEQHLTFGCDTIGLGMMPSEYRADNFNKLPELIDLFNGFSETAKSFNLNFAYHNHWFEFDKLKNGKTVLQELSESVPDLQFIFDTYWAYFSGQSIEEYAKLLSGKLKNIHFKDGKKLFGKIPCFKPLGDGRLDFEIYVPLFKRAGTKNVLIEQDIAANPFKAVEKSLKFCRETLIK